MSTSWGPPPGDSVPSRVPSASRPSPVTKKGRALQAAWSPLKISWRLTVAAVCGAGVPF